MEHLPIMLTLGLGTILAFYAGRLVRGIGLPSLLGYMLLGAVMGSSVLSLLGEHELEGLRFITDIALGFVAFTIGAELNLKALRRLGSSIILIIFAESLAAFTIVFATVYAVFRDMPMAILFGALAPASAPAGTVAVIQEYKAKGKLTKALYAVVGFDDGLAVVIFGFASALAVRMLNSEVSQVGGNLLSSVTGPILEIGLSLGVGAGVGLLFSFLSSKLKNPSESPSLVFGFVIMTAGLSHLLDTSLILTCMTVGMIFTNTVPSSLTRNVMGNLGNFMHLLFILFFFLAGAHLEISALPSLGLLGLVYVLARSAGLMGGAWLGAAVGGADEKIRKYLGLGILSQAGVAIGLSLLVQQFCSEIGTEHALKIGATIITTVTATSIIFEIIGPVCTKYALTKAGEIKAGKDVVG